MLVDQILSDILDELKALRQEVSAFHNAANKVDCFYPCCDIPGKHRKCTCGDHSYGPSYRKYGGWMCKHHSKEHMDCAESGNW